MKGNPGTVLVLWANRFEEALAVAFIVELRKAGLPVKLVGLHYQRTRGEHGVALIPDITIEQAMPLASNTVCIITPCNASELSQIENDPRLHTLFEQSNNNKSKFIFGQINSSDLSSFEFLPSSGDFISIPPDSENLINLARQITDSLIHQV